jgi:hypothetical protein
LTVEKFFKRKKKMAIGVVEKHRNTIANFGTYLFSISSSATIFKIRLITTILDIPSSLFFQLIS